MIPDRRKIFPDNDLPNGDDIVAEGKKLSRLWNIGPSAFHDYFHVRCEAEYKRNCIRSGRITQHAHMGFRDKGKSLRAFSEIYQRAESAGVRVDRFGLCLDWSMGFPRAMRDKQLKGTGLILQGPEEFAEIANAAPAATHFGDFVLGFPGALENTQGALSAGATVIGNLGQYFSFRLPNWTDDIATTTHTLQAIALMAAQPDEVLVHSNLDDGFAGVFEDLSCALGAALLERYIVEDLVGGKVTHCFGHHYTTPVLRLGFQKALSQVSPNPGSMIYGNTTSYLGNDAQNYASLGSYLTLDILGQLTNPSGHAINPVPTTENIRIPEIDEIVSAQLFAGRLSQSIQGYTAIYDQTEVDEIASILVKQGTKFYKNVLVGLENSGVNILDPFEMLLAIRRIGGKQLEVSYGPGERINEESVPQAFVLSDTIKEIHHIAECSVKRIRADHRPELLDGLKEAEFTVMTATTDVHAHSKKVLEKVLSSINVTPIDGGTSVEPHELAAKAEQENASAIALSTYNGVALTYYCQLRDQLKEIGLDIPIMIGGQLNEIPEDSANSLPVDVESKLIDEGADVCHGVEDVVPVLLALYAAR